MIDWVLMSVSQDHEIAALIVEDHGVSATIAVKTPILKRRRIVEAPVYFAWDTLFVHPDVWPQAAKCDHVPREIDDLDRLTHVQNEDLASLWQETAVPTIGKAYRFYPSPLRMSPTRRRFLTRLGWNISWRFYWGESGQGVLPGRDYRR